MRYAKNIVVNVNLLSVPATPKNNRESMLSVNKISIDETSLHITHSLSQAYYKKKTIIETYASIEADWAGCHHCKEKAWYSTFAPKKLAAVLST